MKSSPHGESALHVEVQRVSALGFWVCIGERQVFASFSDFPWFQDASARELAAVERLSLNHLFWPELDIDLAVDSLEHPNRYHCCPTDFQMKAA